MKSLSSAILICLASVTLASTAHGQYLQVSLSGSLDAPDGSAYAYASTTSDYATGYYYALCTSVNASAEEDDGTWNGYESSTSCGDTDAEVSWSFSVPTDTDFIQLDGQHQEWTYYWVYQVDGDCGFDGYYCDCLWDAFEASLLAGDEVGSGGSWTLYGSPAIGYYGALIQQGTMLYVGAVCPFPNGESSSWVGIGPFPRGFYDAMFTVTLSLGPNSASSFAGRQVQEVLSNVTSNCDNLGQHGPADEDQFTPWTWTVQMSGSNAVYGTSSTRETSTSYDFIGANKSWVNADAPLLAAGASCTEFTGKQAMYISSCQGSTWFSYESGGHSLSSIITNTSVTDARSTASGAGK